MKILIDIGHPAHVHLFKNFAKLMIQSGNDVLFTCREKEFEIDLLEAEGFNYKSFGAKFHSVAGKIFGLFVFNLKLLYYSIGFKPDIFVSAGSIYASHIAFLMKRPHISFEDTGNMEQIRLYLPFTQIVFCPRQLPEHLGKKEFRYDGYHELAYLAPKYFKPSDEIYKFLGVESQEKFAILRFVSWNATHDVGQAGFSAEEKDRIVEYLSKKYTLFISSESEVPEKFEKYKISIPPDKIHDALYFAELVVSEGATMASESGVLGTPSFYVNSLRRCYNEDQENFGLVFNFQTADGLFEKIIEIENLKNRTEEFKERRTRMLKTKIDVTAFLVWFVKEFPDSEEVIRNNEDYLLKFRL